MVSEIAHHWQAVRGKWVHPLLHGIELCQLLCQEALWDALLSGGSSHPTSRLGLRTHHQHQICQLVLTEA